MHDGISFEQLGKRAIVLCTHPFEVTSRNIARMLGIPDYPFVMVDHPIGSASPDGIKARAEVAYRQALPILQD
ncbi:MAG: hypothetical protein CMQ61_11320 [Gammaproteobacteria bacterium]|nr:hypothetical protein [Gammaproteobacteria bacterium]